MRVLADDFTERPVSRTVESRGIDTSASDMNFFQASLVDRASSPGSQNSMVGTNALSEQSSHLTRLSKRATKGLRDLSLNKNQRKCIKLPSHFQTPIGSCPCQSRSSAKPCNVARK